MPSSWCVCVYKLTTSTVTTSPGVTVMPSRFFSKFLVSIRYEGTPRKHGRRSLSRYLDNGSVRDPLPAIIGPPGGFFNPLWTFCKTYQFGVDGLVGNNFAAILFRITFRKFHTSQKCISLCTITGADTGAVHHYSVQTNMLTHSYPYLSSPHSIEISIVQ